MLGREPHSTTPVKDVIGGARTTQPWSNGPVEGQVNRLKTIKRQMYGRAGLALLRARVLHVG